MDQATPILELVTLKTRTWVFFFRCRPLHASYFALITVDLRDTYTKHSYCTTRTTFPTIFGLTPSLLETLSFTTLLEFSIGRDLGALKGLKSLDIQKLKKPKSVTSVLHHGSSVLSTIEIV